MGAVLGMQLPIRSGLQAASAAFRGVLVQAVRPSVCGVQSGGATTGGRGRLVKLATLGLGNGAYGLGGAEQVVLHKHPQRTKGDRQLDARNEGGGSPLH